MSDKSIEESVNEAHRMKQLALRILNEVRFKPHGLTEEQVAFVLLTLAVHRADAASMTSAAFLAKASAVFEEIGRD